MDPNYKISMGPLSHGALDIEVELALEEAVAEAKQDPKLAKRLIRWLAEVAQGRSSMGNDGETDRFFDAARQVIRRRGI